MKCFVKVPLFVLLLAGASTALATDGHHPQTEIEELRGIVKRLVHDNDQFVRSHKPSYYKPFMNSQHPRATVVTCADSRVHESAWDKTADNDLFVVRNIGNQLETAEGSVEYGVQHLHTPLLIIVGHAACGAIQAASGDYSKLSAAIRKELDTIAIPKGGESMAGVKANVHNQVQTAIKKFRNEVENGELTVMGAVYDFRNELKKGQGRLVVIDINGTTEDTQINKKISALLKARTSSTKSNHD